MFWYAAGPFRETTRPAGSAFSDGMIVTYDTGSNLSEPNLLAAVADARVAGVATASSEQSIGSEVPFVVAQPNTVFWADIPTNVTSEFTDGWRLDIVAADSNISANTGDHVVINSANTPRVAIAARGDFDTVIDSDRSRVLVNLLGAGGEQTFL